MPAPIAANPEISERPGRRTCTGLEKLRILKEADQAAGSGAIGALLRRHGFYSSALSERRRQRETWRKRVEVREFDFRRFELRRERRPCGRVLLPADQCQVPVRKQGALQRPGVAQGLRMKMDESVRFWTNRVVTPSSPPSFAYGTTAENLVFWDRPLPSPNRLAVIDDEHRLPRNQSAWPDETGCIRSIHSARPGSVDGCQRFTI